MPGKRSVVRYKNTKVAIIGNRDTGKLSLKRALLGESFMSEIAATEKSQLRLLDRQDKSYEDGSHEIRETLICDMDRPSDYRLIHQMYLHEVAIILIAHDVRSNGTLETGLSECVQALRRFKSQSSTALKMFLVITCKDRVGRESRFFSRRIEELKKELDCDEVFETSAKKGWDIDKLREAIFKAIDWEKQPEVCSMALMQEVQNFLRDRKEEGRQLFPQEDLYKAFEKFWAVTNSQDGDPCAQFEACLRYIEAKGIIHWFSADNYILLQPSLVDSYIARLLDEAQDDPEDLGCIDEESARQGRFFPLTEGERVKDRALERILLGSIVNDFLNYKFAFRGHGDGNTHRTSLIFPSQFSQENYNPPGSEKPCYIFHFEGEIATIYLTLVVRLAYSEIFVKEASGRNSVTYIVETGKRGRLSLEVLSKTQGSLTLSFDKGVSEKIRKVLAAYVFVHLVAYDKNTAGKSLLRCPNPECGITFNEDQENHLRANHRYEFHCPACGTDMKLPEGELFPTPPDMQQHDPHADKPRIAEEIKKRKQRGEYDVFLSCNDREQQDKREALRIYDELEKRGIAVWFRDRDMPPGVSSWREIEDQISQFKVAVICFGNNGDTRYLELQIGALLNQFIERKCKLIPVLLEHAPREKPGLPFLKDSRWVDFHERDSNPIEQLIWGIMGERP